MFAASPACVGGVSAVVPVDLYIAGCPPTPLDLLKGAAHAIRPVSDLNRPQRDLWLALALLRQGVCQIQRAGVLEVRRNASVTVMSGLCVHRSIT